MWCKPGGGAGLAWAGEGHLLISGIVTEFDQCRNFSCLLKNGFSDEDFNDIYETGTKETSVNTMKILTVMMSLM